MRHRQRHDVVAPALLGVALSLRQPWAWMVIHGGKTIENRRWNTWRRGELLIHAARGMTRDEYDDAVHFARTIDPAITVPPPDDLQRGGIVGRARIVGVIPPCSAEPSLFGKPCDHRWHMPEQYGFQLGGIQALAFRPLRGELGFFRVEVDDG